MVFKPAGVKVASPVFTVVDTPQPLPPAPVFTPITFFDPPPLQMVVAPAPPPAPTYFDPAPPQVTVAYAAPPLAPPAVVWNTPPPDPATDNYGQPPGITYKGGGPGASGGTPVQVRPPKQDPYVTTPTQPDAQPDVGIDTTIAQTNIDGNGPVTEITSTNDVPMHPDSLPTKEIVPDKGLSSLVPWILGGAALMYILKK